MKYRVLWHDAEDDRSGAPFEIEGQTPSEAYFKAEEYIKELSPKLAERYWRLDIECLIDESGKHLYPDFFLNEQDESAHISANNISKSRGLWGKK